MFNLPNRALVLDPDSRCVVARRLPRVASGAVSQLRRFYRCAGTFVNDVYGPDRTAKHKAARRSRQNIAFTVVEDGAGFPHVFWECIRAIPEGATLWGDYGDGYWRNKGDDDLIFSAALRRLLHTVRGGSAAFPIPLE